MDKNTLSGTFYQVTKDLGNGKYVYWWPLAGFDEACRDKSQAIQQYNKEIKTGKCRLLEVVVDDSIIHSETVLLNNIDDNKNAVRVGSATSCLLC